LWQQFALRTGHKPAARLFHIIPARFFDAFLKMLNRKFRMKIVPGEMFFMKWHFLDDGELLSVTD
jgi:hypothetical protein